MSHPLAKVISDFLYVVVDVLYRLLTLFRREYAQIDAGNAQVTAYLDLTDRNHQSFGEFCLIEEQLAQFLLDEP